MGVGYTTLLYDAQSLETAIGDVAACRYDGIELGLGKLQAAGPETVTEWLDEYDLELYCVMSHWLESDESVGEVADAAETVAALGAEFLGLLPPQRHRNDDSTVETWLGRVSDAARDADLTPVLHHHGGTHVERPDEVVFAKRADALANARARNLSLGGERVIRQRLGGIGGDRPQDRHRTAVEVERFERVVDEVSHAASTGGVAARAANAR